MMLLILDLDETLIHARGLPLSRLPDFSVFDYAVYRRPHLDVFLSTVHEHFDVAVWSSASEDYVAAIVAEIFPCPNALKFLWGRARCTREPVLTACDDWADQEGIASFHFVKKLSKLKRHRYDLKQVLIVDDTPQKCRHNYGNAIYVRPWEGNLDDNELLWLGQYLVTLTNVANVRTLEKRRWRGQIVESSTLRSASP